MLEALFHLVRNEVVAGSIPVSSTKIPRKTMFLKITGQRVRPGYFRFTLGGLGCVGPSLHPCSMVDAFNIALKNAGVSESGKLVILSGIPIRL